MDSWKYVLITAARNEAKYIEGTIVSVVSQTILPEKWVIVSNGSSDNTDDIVRSYLSDWPFISFISIPGEKHRNFGAQVRAINHAYQQLKDLEFEYIGNLDADITLSKTYYENMLLLYRENKNLGIAGGELYEKDENGKFRPRPHNSDRSVPHGIQLFRRECFEAIGGYIPLKFGGPDWYAEVMVRMKGWDVISFPRILAYHHRETCGAEGILRARWRQGRMDSSLGSHPVFEAIKCAVRWNDRPVIIGSFIRFFAFFWGSLFCEKEVPKEFISFLRKEQTDRLYKLKNRITIMY